ncbi:hypothetical protein BCR39DRAFT_559770 [Naematelia encephala]|uniref:Homeobox domain-containing protein n=1 Tax=Naematelia encephala TaxID=71784 RepID=A0A1Y2AZF8_9TREE|nr:hypothetical protein BCR39DRAFT_559770 [Naematelia encephala]
MATSPTLSSRAMNLCLDFPDRLGSFASLDEHVSEWESLAQDVTKLSASGQLSQIEADTLYRAAHNVKVVSDVAVHLDRITIDRMNSLAADLARLCGLTPDPIEQGQSEPGLPSERLQGDNRFLPSPPRTYSDCSPPSSPLLSINNLTSDSLPTPPKSARLPVPRSGPKTHQSTPNLDILREWFLHHLASPYPTPEEKESLANQAGIPRSKVDSDLTNWRRRAGWTDLKDQWANGDRKKMCQLIEKVEAGEEKRKAVVKAVEGVKSYLRREEEERVGDWVHQLTGLITPKQETPRSVSNTSHITSSSDESTNTSVSAVSRQARASKRRTTKRSTSSLSNVSDTLPLSPETTSSTKGSFIFSAPASSIAFSNALKRPHESEPEAQGPRKIAKAEQLSPSAELTVSLQDGSNIQGGSGIWSTEGELPMLPHMTNEHTDRWTIPEHWEFRPAIGAWSES